ncbi:hypothetical protein M5K25_019602 [Dendrobium thyrsiflorum]|uniref:Uncharacterized protein n=1 Tax=Dendrobium thyrsiflorum TaxID=117978 RepID=A0ABD0UF44_DENTH
MYQADTLQKTSDEALLHTLLLQCLHLYIINVITSLLNLILDNHLEGNGLLELFYNSGRLSACYWRAKGRAPPLAARAHARATAAGAAGGVPAAGRPAGRRIERLDETNPTSLRTQNSDISKSENYPSNEPSFFLKRDPRQEEKKRREEEKRRRRLLHDHRRSSAGPPPDVGVLPDCHQTPEFPHSTPGWQSTAN